MKNIYKVNNEVEQSGTNIRLKSRISPTSARITSDSIVSRICLVSLILLIVGGFSTSAWALGYTHTGLTAVGKGKGTAAVKIHYRQKTKESDDAHTGDENSTSGSELVTASYERGITQDGSIAFYATASTGYTFSGWYSSSACSGTPLSTDSWPYWAVKRKFGNDSKTAYAKFSPITYKIAFNKNGGTHGSTAGINSVTYDQDVTLTKNGFYRAKYVVTYNINGGTCATAVDTAYYPFAGWAKTAGGAKEYNDNETLKTPNFKSTQGETQTLFAKWGTGTTSVKLPTPTAAPTYNGNGSYSFAGWYNGNEKVGVAGASYTPTSNVTLTAKWTLTKEPGFSGANQNMSVGAGYTGFMFSNTTTTTPSANSNDKFYYVISNVNVTSATTAGCGEGNSGKVIAVETSGNTTTIRAINKGTAKITFYQQTDAANNIAAGNSETYTFTVDKNTNTISCNWDGWSKSDIRFDEEIATTISSSNNSNSGGYASLNVTQIARPDVATYDKDNNKIVALCGVGEAKWVISQAEDYKYYAATNETISVSVDTIHNSSCDIYTNANGIDVSSWGTSTKLTWTEPASRRLEFEACKSMASAVDDLEIYIKQGDSWGASKYASIGVGDLEKDNLKPFGFDLPEDAVGIYFKGGSYTRSVRNIIVSRKKWFDIKNAAGTSNITSLDMPTRTLSGAATQNSFKIHYSTCSNTIKLRSSSPHVTFANGQTTYSFTPDNTHVKEIALNYNSNEAENTSCTITAYTQYEQKTLTVNVETKDKLATHLVYKGASSYSVDATNIAATDLFEVRDENNDLVANPVITLSTGTASRVTLANDNKSIASLCGNSNSGTPGNIVASYAGDNTHAAATNNGLSQNFTINRLNDEVSFDSGYGSMVVGEEINLAEWATSCTSGSDITITSVLPEFIVIEDGKVKAVKKGKGQLRAESAGNCTYNSGSTSLDITVRDASDPCGSSVLYESSLIKVGAYEHGSDNPKEYTIPDGPQDKLTFKVWKSKSYATQEATLQILDKNGNVLTNGTIDYTVGSIPSSEPDAPNREIDMANYPGAKKLRFYGSGSLNKYFSEVRVSQKAYLTASTSSVTMSTVKACETAEGQFTVDYSDVAHIQLSQTNPGFTYEVWDGNTKLVGFNNDCKQYGTYTIKFFYTPQSKGDYSNTVTLTASGKEQVITLSGTANAPEREIVWDLDLANVISATQSLDLDAYAKTSCENPAGSVYYTWSSSTDNAATIEGSHITFNKAATVTVTANTVASNMYENATAVSKVWTVGKVGTQMRTLPEITSTITYDDNSSVVSWDNKSWEAEDVLKKEKVDGSISYVGPANFTAAGEQNLTFNFSPNNVYAYDVCQFTVPVIVQKKASVATPSVAAHLTYGQQVQEATLNNSGTAGTWAWKEADREEVLGAGSHTLYVDFTPENSNFTTISNVAVTLIVDQASQTIDWNPETNISTIDQILLNGTTNGRENDVMNTITYTVTNNDDVISVTNNVVTILKPGTVTITATQNGSANYAAATPVVKNFTISAEPLTLTAPTADNITYGQALSASTLTGGSAKDSENNTVEGTFAWQSPTTVLNAGDNQTPTVVFTPSTNAAWYTNLTTTATINVAKANQTITWDPATNISTIDQILLNGTTNGRENDVMNAITYTVTNNEGVISVSNNVVTILKPGTVTITATQNGSTNYAAATPVEKNFTISAEPLTLTAPTAQNITYGQALSASELTGGSAKDSKNNTVYGTFAWQTPTTVLNAGDNQTPTVVFTPSENAAWYTGLTTTVTINVAKATPDATPSAEAITYGNAVKTSALSNTGTTAGTWAWKEADEDLVPTAGKYTYLVNFMPNSDNYTALSDVEVELTVNKATPAVTPQATAIEQGQTVSQSTLSTKTGTVPGTWSWKNEDANTKPNQGNCNFWVDFTPDDTENYNSLTDVLVSLTVNAPSTYVFTGEGDWTVDENWNASSDPAEAVDVIVNGNVVISTNVTVKSLTVEDGKSVTITSTGKLTLGEDSSEDRDHYGDLYVHNGGKVVLGEGTLNVNNFVIEAALRGYDNEMIDHEAKSGQLSGDDKLSTQDAYFKISFDPRGAIDYGWYEFVVPFEVEVIGGIFADGDLTTPLRNGVDFLVADFSEAKRAANVNAWSYFKGTMQPGKVYMITLDETRTWNTFVFKKKAGSAIGAPAKFSALCTSTAAAKDRGWNGMGNGTLQYRQLNDLPDNTKIQIFDHKNNRYVEREAANYTYAVGTAFFVQVDEAKDIDLFTVTDTRDFLAPSRYGRSCDEFRLSLMEEESQNVADHLWVSASEDATTEYTIGHDLVKMGTPTDSKVAQMWMPAGELRLCDIEMPLVNNNASTPVSIYAPKAGTYTLAVERAPENAILFLTKNGRVMWNLSQSGYLLDLSKGTTEEYGLCLVYSAPQVATGVDEVVNGVKGQKVIIDNKIYIITNTGAIYDATGKKVN